MFYLSPRAARNVSLKQTIVYFKMVSLNSLSCNELPEIRDAEYKLIFSKPPHIGPMCNATTTRINVVIEIKT